MKRTLTFVLRCSWIVGVLTLLLALAPTVTAADLGVEKTAATPTWSSAAHLGFGFEDQSSTGFNRVGGSLGFLDLEHAVGHGFSAGLRTMANGGEGDSARFYRLSAGPLVSYRINDDWNVQVAFGWFSETGTTVDGSSTYKSKGRAVLLGWERIVRLDRRLEIAFGGFWSRHWGTVNAVSSISPASPVGRYDDVSVNSGGSRGIEVGVRTSL